MTAKSNPKRLEPKKLAPKQSDIKQPSLRTGKDLWIASRILSFLLGLVLLSSFFVIIDAGERGVLMQFGRVQAQALEEGIHWIVPLMNTVEKLSVRVQKQEIETEASSRDLQNVFTDVTLNWHMVPEKTPILFQRIGNQEAIVERILNPAIEEVMKAVIARYTAEEIITKREEVKAEIDRLLTDRLTAYYLAIDDISLVQIHFSKQFGDAVEAKQIAEQEAKRAGFMATKAAKEAEARVNLARGEAEAQQLINQTLTPKLLRKQMIDHWDGKLPLIVGDRNAKLLELELDEIMEQRGPQKSRTTP